MEEILFVDKPKGPSSYDVIRLLKKRTGAKKIGHAGTLDPLASGLLIIGIGPGTKRIREFFDLPKTYVLSLLLGIRTASGDLDGAVIEEKTLESVPDTERIRTVLAGMVGTMELPVPAYSAAKFKGKPRYVYARAGVPIENKMQRIEIRRLELKRVIRDDPRGPVLEIEMEASKGTYARSVGEEIGRRLGAPAVLADLRRTKIGEHDVQNALRLEGFSSRTKPAPN